MIALVTEWFVQWAKESKADSVVCFGSFGRGNTTPSSDLDICIVGNEEIMKELKISIRKNFTGSISFVYHESSKIITFLQKPFNSTGVFKVDCYVVKSLDKVKKYIIGSELTLTHFDRVLLYSDPERGREVEDWLIQTLSERIEPNILTYIEDNTKRFIESFETASNKRAIGDRFQFLFQLHIAYVSLTKLEYVRHGGIHFLYLPKNLLTFLPCEVRKHFEDELEPNGQLECGQGLLQKYLQQFHSTILSLTDEHSSILSNIDISLPEIFTLLEGILLRDQH